MTHAVSSCCAGLLKLDPYVMSPNFVGVVLALYSILSTLVLANDRVSVLKLCHLPLPIGNRGKCCYLLAVEYGTGS